jgi:hypothetical protein
MTLTIFQVKSYWFVWIKRFRVVFFQRFGHFNMKLEELPRVLSFLQSIIKCHSADLPYWGLPSIYQQGPRVQIGVTSRGSQCLGIFRCSPLVQLDDTSPIEP